MSLYQLWASSFKWIHYFPSAFSHIKSSPNVGAHLNYVNVKFKTNKHKILISVISLIITRNKPISNQPLPQIAAAPLLAGCLCRTGFALFLWGGGVLVLVFNVVCRRGGGLCLHVVYHSHQFFFCVSGLTLGRLSSLESCSVVIFVIIFSVLIVEFFLIDFSTNYLVWPAKKTNI